MTIYRGRIVGLFRDKGGSGIALLAIEDDARGKVMVPCDGNPTCRAFDLVFPGTLRAGTFYNDAIRGEVILYELDSVGVLKSFAPADRAPLEKIAQYESQSAPPKKGTYTRGGLLPPGDPLYSSGPIVSGRLLSETPKRKPSEFN